MSDKKPNPNAGHRERMRQRFLANGFNGFQPHEIIELMLFYTIPRQDTNKIAHELINTFHTISGVLDADIQDLCKIKGISHNSALYLKMLPAFFREYEISKRSGEISFADYDEAIKYIKSLYISETHEKVYVICLDAQAKIVSTTEISSGTFTATAFNNRSIAEAALKSGCDRIVLIHNHPDGNPVPSDKDVYCTTSLAKFLKSLGVTLEDHCIVGRYVLSLRKYGYLDML